MWTVETSRHKVLLSQSFETFHQWVLKMFNKLYHHTRCSTTFPIQIHWWNMQDEPNRLRWCVVVLQWGHTPKTSRPGSEPHWGIWCWLILMLVIHSNYILTFRMFDALSNLVLFNRTPKTIFCAYAWKIPIMIMMVAMRLYEVVSRS